MADSKATSSPTDGELIELEHVARATALLRLWIGDAKAPDTGPLTHALASDMHATLHVAQRETQSAFDAATAVARSPLDCAELLFAAESLGLACRALWRCAGDEDANVHLTDVVDVAVMARASLERCAAVQVR